MLVVAKALCSGGICRHLSQWDKDLGELRGNRLRREGTSQPSSPHPSRGTKTAVIGDVDGTNPTNDTASVASE